MTKLFRMSLFVALAALGACATEERPADPGVELELDLPAAPGMNVVVVSFDALRADALGLYGYELETSPHIDRFASRALVFDRAYSPAPVTPTSFAAAFTGLLPHRVFRGWKLTASDTLASWFSDHGYTTAAFLNNVQMTEERGFGAGFDTYQAFRSRPDERALEEAVSWLDANLDRKFLLWLHILSPHSPYEYRSLAEHLYDPEYSGDFERTTTGRFDTDDPKEIKRIRSLYDGEVFYADSLFGSLLESFEDLGLLTDTLVVLTSDHGEEFKERGGWQHQHLNEETIRVPLLIYHPGVRKGSRTELPFSLLDLAPTLAALAGVPIEEPLDGRNVLMPVLSNRPLISEAMTDSNYRAVAVVRGNQKLILTCEPSRTVELFDLSEDPSELDDLATKQRRTRSELLRLLRLVYQGEPCEAIRDAVQGLPASHELSEETLRELKALGYLR